MNKTKGRGWGAYEGVKGGVERRRIGEMKLVVGQLRSYYCFINVEDTTVEIFSAAYVGGGPSFWSRSIWPAMSIPQSV